MNKKNTFISYSRSDKYFLEGVVSLLRSQGGIVFFDSDSITPGEKWRDALQNAISASDQMIIIWCCHSAKSEEVAAEIEFGLTLNKPIIPVLCCDFPIEEKLSEFQWIDVREFVNHKPCDHFGVPWSSEYDLGEEKTIVLDQEILGKLPKHVENESFNRLPKSNSPWHKFRWLQPLFIVAAIAILLFLRPPFFTNLIGDSWISSGITWDIIRFVLLAGLFGILIRSVINFNSFMRTKSIGMDNEVKGTPIVKDPEKKDEYQAAKLILSAIEETQSDPTRYYPKKD